MKVGNMKIKDFEDYEITKSGQVINTRTGRTRALDFNKTVGYFQVDLYKRNKRTKHYIHRLVAQAYIPNPEGLPEVNHKDSDRTNNHVSNLEWVTSSGNSVHAIEAGRMTYKRRMSEQDIKKAYELFMSGMSYQQISDTLENSWKAVFLSIKVKQYAERNNLLGELEAELKRQRNARALKNLESVNK